MKSSLSNQITKIVTSNNSVKSKKSSKDREKRKSSGPPENNQNDKGSPSKVTVDIGIKVYPINSIF